VWRDSDRIVAWGWLEGPGELTVQADPAYPAVVDEVLAWAEHSSPVPVSTTISSNEPHIAAALTTRGYRAALDGPFFSCLGIDPKTLPQAPALPDGYELLQCDAAHVATRAAAHREAWSAWGSTYREQQHAAMRGLWPYKAEFDLLAVAPDGTPAAYYQGWYDEVSRVGHFEPVGTHPLHRRLGLSRALGTALLGRFAAAGARMATVNPRGDDAYPVARLTYESMGFTSFGRTHTYAKPNA
jgi:GNAT superfamily N-acetyltransferase